MAYDARKESTLFSACLRAPFVEETILASLNYFGIFVEKQLTINVRVYFWTLDSIPMIHMSNVSQYHLKKMDINTKYHAAFI